MTPRTFFTILLKILGIYLVMDSIAVIPEFISSIAMLTIGVNRDRLAEFTTGALSCVLIFCVFFER